MRNKVIDYLFFGILIFLVSCGGRLGAVSQVANLYTNARAIYTGYNAMNMVKEFKEGEDIFRGVEAIRVKTEIFPRDEEKGTDAAAAFGFEIYRVLSETLIALDRPETEVCFSFEKCGEGKKVVTVHFREGKRKSLVTKLLAGDILTGDLYFIDTASGSIIKEEKIDDAKNYADLEKFVAVSLMRKLIGEKKDDPNLEEYVKKVNSIKLLSEENEKLLAKVD